MSCLHRLSPSRPNVNRLLLSCLCVPALFSFSGPSAAESVWTELRRSALLPGDEVTVRVEGTTAAGATNEILYEDGGIVSAPMDVVADGPNTLEATVPGPTAGSRPYGFRLEQTGNLNVLAVRLDGSAPSPTDLSELISDPVGDEAFGRTNLDLTGCRLSRDDTRLYAALSNAGGGFPVSSGLTFFSYLFGMSDPAVSDPDTVFAMIQTVDVSGIIEPGLYQINGTGIDDLVKIGEITVQEFPGSNTLVLSCLLSDLEANPVFQSWYDPSDPRMGVAGFSQQITVLGGAEEADATEGGIWHLREVSLNVESNLLPELTNLQIPEPGQGQSVQLLYADANANGPVLSELSIDGESFSLRPQALDYTQAVLYESDAALPPIENDEWTTLIARFSDNAIDIVELDATTSSVDGPIAGDEAIPGGEADPGRTGVNASVIQSATVGPNPSANQSTLTFRLLEDQPVALSVYDVRGREVVRLAEANLAAGRHEFVWDGSDEAGRSAPDGVYFFRLRTPTASAVVRVVRNGD